MLPRMDAIITRNFVTILAVFISFIVIVKCLPIGEADKVKEREKRLASSPCLSHSDCLRTQICEWNPTVVELVGTCVTASLHHGRSDQRYRNVERPGRTRKKVLSNDVDDDRKVSRSRQARDSELDSDHHQHDDDGVRRRNDYPDYPNGEVVPKVSTNRGNVEEKGDKIDFFGDFENDKQNVKSQVTRRLPQASYPLHHKLPVQNDKDINHEDEIVIDHFDEKGLPVVVITEDNRDQQAEIDTSKDFYVFGEEVDDDIPDAKAKTESIVYDYVDGSDVYDAGDDDDGEGKEVVIDLKGGKIHPGIQTIFSNPWGIQPIKTIPRPVDDMVDDEDEEYLNDDVQVYGVGDHQQVEPRFRHIDLTGMAIETDVGVDQFSDRQPAPRLTSADHTGIALPGLLTKDLDAHNY